MTDRLHRRSKPALPEGYQFGDARPEDDYDMGGGVPSWAVEDGKLVRLGDTVSIRMRQPVAYHALSDKARASLIASAPSMFQPSPEACAAYERVRRMPMSEFLSDTDPGDETTSRLTQRRRSS